MMYRCETFFHIAARNFDQQRDGKDIRRRPDGDGPTVKMWWVKKCVRFAFLLFGSFPLTGSLQDMFGTGQSM
jgi:hypothetical protein